MSLRVRMLGQGLLHVGAGGSSVRLNVLGGDLRPLDSNANR